MKQRPLRILLAAALFAPVACNDVDSGGGTEPGLTLAVTDAASDEIASFVVDVESVQLERSDGGGVVGVLPMPVTVDLATLTEVRQVLNVTNVPPGVYDQAMVTLDLQNASAYLVGQTVPATLLDEAGLPLGGSVTLPVSLLPGLVAQVNRNRLLDLDFDLDHSLQVDAVANSITFAPALFVRIDPTDTKELVALGDLVSVDPATSSFVLDLQTLSGTSLGMVPVYVTPSTVYQHDGAPVQGSPGLATLAGLPAGTWVQVVAQAHPYRARLDALYVESGTGTYNGGSDIVQGHVVGRVGLAGDDPTLMVLGHGDEGHATFTFNTVFTVNLSRASTRVAARGSLAALDTDDLDVGQRVRVFGDLTGTTMDATAVGSVVRVQPTRVLGFANGEIAGGGLDVELARVDLRDQAQFAWAEGGNSTLAPPDPMALTTFVGNLGDMLMIGDGTAVELRGYFTAVDQGPPHFVATSLVNRDLAPSLLLVANRAGGMTFGVTTSQTELTLDLAGMPVTGELAIVDRGFVGPIALPALPAPTVAPAGPLGLYVIDDRALGSATLYLNFDFFRTHLGVELGTGAVARDLGAIGAYDAGTNSMSAGLIRVVIE